MTVATAIVASARLREESRGRIGATTSKVAARLGMATSSLKRMFGMACGTTLWPPGQPGVDGQRSR